MEMQRFHVNVIKGRGSYYELGKLAAQQFKKTPLYETHEKRRKKSMKSYKLDLEKAYGYYERIAPGLWEELRGVASELPWVDDSVFHEYAGFQADWKKSGCSAFMKDGYYARNYDYHPKTYEGRLLLWQPEGGYASIGTSGRMIGRIDGMNEKGLVVGYHFVNRRNPVEGFICSIIARFLLDTCASVAEAVALLEELPHRHAFNYSLLDREGMRAIVEASGRGTHVHYENVTACTNHFTDEAMLKENRYHLVESKERLETMQKREHTPMTAEEAFYFFNDPEQGVFKKNYGSWSGTIHTAVYEPSTLTMYFGIGENATPLKIPFGNWLEGDHFPVTKLFGYVDTKEAFGHINQVEVNHFAK